MKRKIPTHDPQTGELNPYYEELTGLKNPLVVETYQHGQRPWGTYTILHEDTGCKVKQIFVKPNSRLSYQYHHKRQENWTVTSGTLTVVLEGVEHTLTPGESIHIPLGAKHRAWNKSNEDVYFIEVQTGTYFGEDDIVRIEDDFNRK